MTSVWYCTREDVKSALDSPETARSNAQVDREIEAASRSIESLMDRRFYPWTGTRYFNWPDHGYGSPDTLFLGADELISVTTLTTDGTTVVAGDYFLEPVNEGPPYNRIEIDRDSDPAAEFITGDTNQRTIVITGLFGYTADSAPAGALAAAVSSTTATTLTVTDSSLIGVGQLIRVDDERMNVTGKAMLDTGVNIDAGDSLTAAAADVSITMSTATGAPAVGEVILIGSERMLVVDLAGLVLTVKRAWDGSVLAPHAGSADIYAPRTLTVERGVLGTTAATHLTAAAVTKHVVPGLIRQLCIAEALTALLQEGSGYARVVGSGDSQREASGRGLLDVREQAIEAHQRGLLV